VAKLDSSPVIFLGVALGKHSFILPRILDTGNTKKGGEKLTINL